MQQQNQGEFREDYSVILTSFIVRSFGSEFHPNSCILKMSSMPRYYAGLYVMMLLPAVGTVKKIDCHRRGLRRTMTRNVTWPEVKTHILH